MIALMAFTMVASVVSGAALTTERDTPSKSGDTLVLGVLTNTRIFAGGMVAMSNQYARPAQDQPSYQVVGRCAKTADNRVNVDGAGDSGAVTVQCDIGIFRWANGGSVFTDQHIGDYAYVHDDQTVTNSGAANDIVAGVIVDVDSSGVWVQTGRVADKALAGTSLTLTGSATVGGNLDVTSAITGVTITSTTSVVSGEAVIDGKYAVVGPDGTTGLMVQAGSDIAVGGTGNVAFATAFAADATTYVVITPMQNFSAVLTNQTYVHDVTKSQFDYVVDSATGTIYWAAYGARP